MKKALSLILALVMVLSLTVPAFAETDNSTDITLTVEKSLTYDMVIPEDVTDLANYGIYEVGKAKVANVKNATDNTVISYTATTTNFKSEGKTDIPASYYTDAQGAAAFPTTAVEVYKAKSDAASIPTMYVGITEANWNAAENGTYKATVTFAFENKEVPASSPIPEGGEYKLSTGTTLSAGDAFPETPTTGDAYTYGDYKYTYNADYNGSWNAKVNISTKKASYGALLETILDKPINLSGTFEECSAMTSAPALPAGVRLMDHCFDGCTKLATKPTIPTSVVDMNSCFDGCIALVSAPVIPQNVTKMSSCFNGCSKLAAAPELPSGVEDISNCFCGCIALVTAPAIPDSVTAMNSCFEDCTNLTTASTIPANVEYLGYCFGDCAKLAGTIEINAENEYLDYYGCFEGAGASAGSITLTGSCPVLEDIAATNGDGNVVVGVN